MRELGRLRQRLLAAMGVVAVAAPACGTDQGASGGGAVTDVASGDTALGDGGGAGGDAATDSSSGDASTDGSAGDAVADSASGDAATDSSSGDAATDSSSGDAVADGAGGDVATDSGAGDAVADAGADAGSGDAFGGVTCSFGKVEQSCFTAAQLAWAVDNKWGGGAPGDDAGGSDAGSTLDYPVPPEGCPVRERVFDGCCNPAQAGPIMVGDTCCYAFCTGACCGRPLLVAGRALVAATGPAVGWAPLELGVEDEVAVAALDPITRAALAEAWAADAAMEHASIASFARFGLELLRFGAPAGLCADAARAALDEVDHAERCFALASQIGGAALGPGPLPLGDKVALADDLDAAVAAAIAEGCVGETFAAAFAAEAARVATVAGVRDALTAIAADEARHAELAWRFVRWALLEATPEAERSAALGRAAGAFEVALAALPEAVAPAGVDAAAWAAFGRLLPRRQRTLALATAREVIWPCARALLGTALGPARWDQGVALA